VTSAVVQAIFHGLAVQRAADPGILGSSQRGDPSQPDGQGRLLDFGEMIGIFGTNKKM
jgi:hypothetical protein